MISILIQAAIFLVNLIRTARDSYTLYQKTLAKKLKARQATEANPQEDALPGENEGAVERGESNQCVLCFGPRIYTTATTCGHLFCWDCI